MVTESAQKLGEALVQSEQYKNYVTSKKNVDGDATASNLLTMFSEKEEEMRQAMYQAPDQANAINALSLELRQIRTQISENEMLNELAKAQSDFNALMTAVNEIIGHYIAPQSECSTRSESGGGCSGNCGSCH